MAGSNPDFLSLLRRAVELVMPNLRHYYRVPRKGRVVKSYASDGSYWADVQPLRNDDSVDEKEPVISKVEIPVLWGGPERGVVCPPAEGTYCDITYYDGDPHYPRISNFRWAKNGAPSVDLDGFIIQQSAGCYFLVKPDGTFELKGNGKWIGSLTVTAGIHSDAAITCDSTVSDHTRSLDGDRTIYNGHHHGTGPAPTEKM
jgi:hypothetical protein